MGFEDLAIISIVTPDRTLVVAGGDKLDWEGIRLNEDPEGIFDTEVELKTIDVSGMPGGFDGGEETPVRTMKLPFNVYATPDRTIEQQLSAVRRLFWRKTFQYHYDTQHSGLRWLNAKRSKSIKVNPKRDWNLDGYATAVVEAVALNPDYESQAFTVKTPVHPGGTATYWLPVWNPTDRRAWPIWAIKPNGTATVSLPDFSFGNEQEIDQTGQWQPGDHDDRMIVLEDLTQMRSVMADPVMDPYVDADLSNADGQMGGVEPLYWIPEYTGTEDDPVMLPVIIDGPAGAQVKLRLRRFWSAEMGGEAE